MAETVEIILPPSARVSLRWTPQLIESARRQAEAGDLSRAVQICDWLLTDDAVRAALGARVDAVVGLDVEFEPADEDQDVDTDPQIEALSDDWDTSYPEQETAQILTWGLLLGVAPARHEVRTADEAGQSRMLPCPRFWHPGTLAQDRQTEQWTVRDILGQPHVVTPGDGEWLLYRPFGDRRPWSMGLWQTLAMLVLHKCYAVEDWARTSERSSILHVESMIDKDGNLPTGVVQRDDLAAKLAGRGADAVAIMPPGLALKLTQIADNYAVYQERITMINDAIASVIRGGNLTTHTSGGSKAAAETQAANGDAPKRKSDSAILSSFYRTQSIVWWSTWNFGDASGAPWPRWSVPAQTPEVNYFSFANGLQTLTDMGFELNVETLKADYGLTFIESYDPKNAKPDAPAPGFGGKPKASPTDKENGDPDAAADAP